MNLKNIVSLLAIALLHCSLVADEPAEGLRITKVTSFLDEGRAKIYVSIRNNSKEPIRYMRPTCPHALGVWTLRFTDSSGALVSVGRVFEPTMGRIDWATLDPGEETRVKIDLKNGEWLPCGTFSDLRVKEFYVEFNMAKPEHLTGNPKVWAGNLKSEKHELAVELRSIFRE